jgi:hypothetical protein
MKKALLYVLLMPIAFFSCKKDHSTKPNNVVNNSGKYYKVNINLAGFTQTILNSVNSKKTNAITPLDPSDTSNTDTLSLLYYYVYVGNNASYLHSKVLHANHGVFAEITDSLKVSNYDIIIVAGKNGLTYHDTLSSRSSYYNYNLADNNLNAPTSWPFSTWHDTFATEFTIVLTGGDTTVNVTLPRVVGNLEVNITDAIPANTDHISMNIANVVQSALGGPLHASGGPPFYFLKASTLVYQQPVPAVSKGTTNYTFDNILCAAGTTEPMTVEIMAYDSSNNLIGDAVVNNVTLTANEKTILTGNLFGGGQGNSLPVGINAQWQVTPYKNIGF